MGNTAFDKETALSDFSKGFNSFLLRKKLKSADIAKELDVKSSSVSTWKNGRGFPEFTRLFKLFEMGMTLEEMFGERLAKVIEENSGLELSDEKVESLYGLKCLQILVPKTMWKEFIRSMATESIRQINELKTFEKENARCGQTQK